MNDELSNWEKGDCYSIDTSEWYPRGIATIFILPFCNRLSHWMWIGVAGTGEIVVSRDGFSTPQAAAAAVDEYLSAQENN
jgi:hypothetical protein